MPFVRRLTHHWFASKRLEHCDRRILKKCYKGTADEVFSFSSGIAAVTRQRC